MASGGPLVIANRLDDLEAVQFRHVHIQEQEVEFRSQETGVRGQ